jgi:phosphoribosylaminoimidazolecarboxamide formyltransferase/IMP cyclohydrolase
MCSFGDFAAVSHTVDVATAKLLKPIVCDGIIAPAYEPEALEILRAKKKGAFIVLQGDGNFVPPTDEYRELFGVALSQRRNDQVFSAEHLNNVVVVGSGLQEGTTGAGKRSLQHDLVRGLSCHLCLPIQAQAVSGCLRRRAAT